MIPVCLYAALPTGNVCGHKLEHVNNLSLPTQSFASLGKKIGQPIG
jgi:hypothetical protein